MGIGAVMDGLVIGLKGLKGSDEVGSVKSVEEQTVAKGIDEVAESPEAFRGHANKPVADPPQGSLYIHSFAGDVNKQLSRTRNELGAEGGSTDSLTRPIELTVLVRATGLAPKEVKRIMEDFMSTDYVIKEVAKAKKMGVPLHEVWGDATASMKEMFEGRLRTDLTHREWGQ